MVASIVALCFLIPSGVIGWLHAGLARGYQHYQCLDSTKTGFKTQILPCALPCLVDWEVTVHSVPGRGRVCLSIPTPLCRPTHGAVNSAMYSAPGAEYSDIPPMNFYCPAFQPTGGNFGTATTCRIKSYVCIIFIKSSPDSPVSL